MGDTDASGDEHAGSNQRTRPRRWLRWLVGIGVGLLIVVTVAVVWFLLATRNPPVSAFYDPPDDLSGPPGTILRSESFDQGLPAGSRGWKVLYISTDPAGEPIAVSGLVIAPADPEPGPHPVLAWAHGTIGIARPCAPSNTDEPRSGTQRCMNSSTEVITNTGSADHSSAVRSGT